MASIYILFPKENQELLGSAMEHFHWTAQRFEAMKEKNLLARSARGVLQAIYVKFSRAVGSLPPGSESARSFQGSPSLASTDTPAIKATSGTTPSSGPESAVGARSSYPPPSATNDWTMPSSGVFDFSSIAPLYPLGDLLYNDLNGIPEDGMRQPRTAEMPVTAFNGQPWQVEGVFGTDSFWSLLNQYDPGPPG